MSKNAAVRYSERLKDSALVLCSNCNAKVYGTIDIPADSHGVPDDLSLIQIGTKGKYLNKKFEIVGRVRMQMKDDFRSLWCAMYDDDKNPVLWICQSLESLAFGADTFKQFPPNSDIDMNAAGKVVFGDKKKLTVSFAGAPRYLFGMKVRSLVSPETRRIVRLLTRGEQELHSIGCLRGQRSEAYRDALGTDDGPGRS
ncbi:MAG: hypothetical protein WDO15_19935 [Bacteroidota bacterium]